jgi:hypothetical protein
MRLINRKPGRSLKCSASPGKVRYKDERKAAADADLLNAFGGDEQRVYFCKACQGWHMTHVPAADIYRRGDRVKKVDTKITGEVVSTKGTSVTVKWDEGRTGSVESRKLVREARK